MSRSSNEIRRLRRLAGKRRWSETDGRFAVEVWRDSGLALETFARTHGLGGWRLRRWASKLGEVMALGATTSSARQSGEPRLVPAIVTVGAKGDGVGPAIILRLPDGIEVELRDVAWVEPEEIGRLVAEVRRGR